MRKFGAVILVVCAAITIFILPGRILHWNAANADYATAVERLAEIEPGGRQYLDFSDLDQLRDLPPAIAAKSDLERLNLSNTDITDIRPLAGLKNLKYLSMNNVPVKDLSSLSGLRSLVNLSISRTWVFDLAPISGLTNLDQLNLSYTAVKSLKPLMQLRRIRQLTLYRSYAHDGSHDYFVELSRNIPRVNSGSAYKQNYQPGLLYRIKISYQRFRQSWMFDRPQIT